MNYFIKNMVNYASNLVRLLTKSFMYSLRINVIYITNNMIIILDFLHDNPYKVTPTHLCKSQVKYQNLDLFFVFHECAYLPTYRIMSH